MAHEKPLLDLSLPVAADYSAKQYYIMKQNSSSQAELASTAGEKVIGVLQDDPDTAGEVGAVRVMGVTKVETGGTITVDDYLVANASGQAITRVSEDEYVVGRALASGVSGDIISMLMPAGAIPASSVNSGTIQLPLAGWQEQDGTALADFADGASTTPGYSAGDESFGIRWNNHANPDPISTSFTIPADADTTADFTLNILAAKVGATIGDAVTWLVEAFANVDAALYDADTDFGGTSSAMTGDAATKTCQLETLALAAANIPTAGQIVLTVQPTDGTLGTDDVIILGAWVTYTRA